MNKSVNYRGALGADGERVKGRKARGVQVAGGNKLQVADVLFPFLLMKSVLPKTNLFFFFSFLKPWAGNGSTNQYSRQLFMAAGHLVPSCLKSAFCGRRAG